MENLFLPDSLANDTISHVLNQSQFILQSPEKSIWDILFSVATIVIALVNILLVVYIYSQNNKKSDDHNDRVRKLRLLKTLILDYNMRVLYAYYDDVKLIVKRTQNKPTIEEKGQIIEELTDLASSYRQNFIDLFLAVDKSLYQKIIDNSDALIDGLTETIFDEGINLSHEPKFDELITKRIGESKTGVVQILFSYSGG